VKIVLAAVKKSRDKIGRFYRSSDMGFMNTSATLSHKTFPAAACDWSRGNNKNDAFEWQATCVCVNKCELTFTIFDAYTDLTTATPLPSHSIY